MDLKKNIMKKILKKKLSFGYGWWNMVCFENRTYTKMMEMV